LYPRGDARRLSRSAAFYIAYFLDNQRFFSLHIIDGRARQPELALLTQRILNDMVAITFDLHAGDTPVCLPGMPLQL
jgi:hypothetical protein